MSESITIIGPVKSTLIVVSPGSPVRVTPGETHCIGPLVQAVPGERLTVNHPEHVTIVRSTRLTPTAISPAHIVSVQPPPRGAWDERGWTRTRETGVEVYEGVYQLLYRRAGERRTFNGRISNRGGRITAFIADPPVEIKRHPHGSCFQLTRAPWFQLHWSRPARNVDDAILYMERVLDECINN